MISSDTQKTTPAHPPAPPRQSPKRDMPAHTPGTNRGESLLRKWGREPGRHDRPPHRTARDSTALNPAEMGPIDPRMPHMPPA